MKEEKAITTEQQAALAAQHIQAIERINNEAIVGCVNILEMLNIDSNEVSAITYALRKAADDIEAEVQAFYQGK